MKNILITLLLFSFLALGACGGEEPNLPQKSKVARIYIDLHIAEEQIRDYSEFESRKDSIFNHYELEEEEYHSIIEEYSDDPEVWEEFFEEAKSYLNKLKRENKAKQDSSQKETTETAS